MLSWLIKGGLLVPRGREDVCVLEHIAYRVGSGGSVRGDGGLVAGSRAYCVYEVPRVGACVRSHAAAGV